MDRRDGDGAADAAPFPEGADGRPHDGSGLRPAPGHADGLPSAPDARQRDGSLVSDPGGVRDPDRALDPGGIAAGGPAAGQANAAAQPRQAAAREGESPQIRHPLSQGKGTSPMAAVAALDAPLRAVGLALDRLTWGQALALEILEALLRAPEPETDAAIDRALARLGAFLGVDRTYVFRLRDKGLLDNTHEWVAAGVAPMIDRLQGLPQVLAAPWFDAFARDEAVEIPDVSALPAGSELAEVLRMQGIRSLLVVPMRSNGRLTGFAGFDSVRCARRHPSGEVYLLRSVANAVDRLLNAREASRTAAAASAALAAETGRLRATLAALPDLVLELDAEGRYVDVHLHRSAGTMIPPLEFLGRRPAEVLPPDMAAVAEMGMRRIDATGYCEALVYPLDGPEGRRWYSATGARRVSVAPAGTGAGVMAMPDARGGDGGAPKDGPEPAPKDAAAEGGAGGYVFVIRDVTREEEQRREIARLSEVARRTTNLVVVTDANRRIEWVNAAWERRSGYTLAEAVGHTPEQLLHSAPVDAGTTVRLRAALEAGRSARAELCNRSRHGTEYWVDLEIQPLHDADGTLRGFMSVEVDITVRRAQSAALANAAAEAERARAALGSAVEALHHGFAWYDAEDRLVLCNTRYRETHPAVSSVVRPGVAFEEILRTGLAQGVYPEAAGREEAWLQDRLAAHRQDVSEIELALSDGRWLRVVERVTPDGGRVGLWVDITALKTAELRALEERAAAMDASLDGIALTDGAGHYVYMNAAHRALFDIGADEDSRSLVWRDLYDAEDAEALARRVQPDLDATGSWRGEVVARRRDGRLLEQELSLTLRPDGGVLAITRDISARRRADQERARLREQLQLAQRREVIGQLAAGLAHDFNNLLATIAGSAALTRGGLPGDHPAHPHLTRINNAAEQAAALVGRLLGLGARRSTGARMDLRVPLREAADLVGAGLGPELRLRLVLPPAPAMAIADASDVLQIVLNLALNARDALAGGPGEIVLSLTEAAPAALAGPFVAGSIAGQARGAPHWAIGVADTGPGMDPAMVGQLFRPYVTTKGDGGTGLGLAIVAGVVAANRGALRLETAPGRGARFTVLWPAAVGHGTAVAGIGGPLIAGSPPSPAAVAATAPQLPAAGLAGRAVLVVEDSQELLEVLTAFLEGAGARVAGTSHPGDALEVLRERPRMWDLLVTDFDMAPMSGADLAVHAHRVAPQLPVLLVTALPDWQVRAAGRTGEFAAVVAKPVTRERLTSAARAALSWRR